MWGYLKVIDSHEIDIGQEHHKIISSTNKPVFSSSQLLLHHALQVSPRCCVGCSRSGRPHFQTRCSDGLDGPEDNLHRCVDPQYRRDRLDWRPLGCPGHSDRLQQRQECPGHRYHRHRGRLDFQHRGQCEHHVRGVQSGRAHRRDPERDHCQGIHRRVRRRLLHPALVGGDPQDRD